MMRQFFVTDKQPFSGGATDEQHIMTGYQKASISRGLANIPAYNYHQFLRHIIGIYDSPLIRAYCRVRFAIININILHMLALCLRGKRRILDVGCGFGLFGCYFSALYPDVNYHGIDVNSNRIGMARAAASGLGLKNATFSIGDARYLELGGQFDAVMMIDLLHHLDDDSKQALLCLCARHLTKEGRLIVKDITTHPFPKLAFTWALDAIMTRGTAMWYWDEQKFHNALGAHFNQVETFPIEDLLPYPHIIYLCENNSLP